MAVNIVWKTDGKVKIKRALISVSDKSGLEALVPGLIGIVPDIKILSTGGTFAAMAELLGPERAAAHLAQVSEYTGQPETQGGLVKTLDFKIYLGLLTETYNESHARDLARLNAAQIDMVVANLYPFEQTVARKDSTPEMARANIDIGGPCMVRAAAKNFLRVASVVDPADYAGILDEMGGSGGTLSLETRFGLARKAFAHTAAYDAAIAKYLAGCDAEKVAACYEVV